MAHPQRCGAALRTLVLSRSGTPLEVGWQIHRIVGTAGGCAGIMFETNPDLSGRGLGLDS